MIAFFRSRSGGHPNPGAKVSREQKRAFGVERVHMYWDVTLARKKWVWIA